MTKPLLALAAALSLSATAALAGTAIQTGDSASGKILTNGAQMSLYVFDKDTGAVSNCYDACAGLWPPVEASKSARPTGEFGIILRTDGARQWAYKGQPLYLWAKDSKPGDITGDGVKGVWHLARP